MSHSRNARCSGLMAALLLMILTLATCAQADSSNVNITADATSEATTKCYHPGANTQDACSKSFDRLWDIRWRVCSHVEAFGFNQGKAHQAWVTNPDCTDRGVFFRSDDQGGLDECFAGTKVTIEQCQLNGCQSSGTCFASGVTHTHGQTFQTVRWLSGDGKPVLRPPPKRQADSTCARSYSGQEAQVQKRGHAHRSKAGRVVLMRRDAAGILSSSFVDGVQHYSVKPGRD